MDVVVKGFKQTGSAKAIGTGVEKVKEFFNVLDIPDAVKQFEKKNPGYKVIHTHITKH